MSTAPEHEEQAAAALHQLGVKLRRGKSGRVLVVDFRPAADRVTDEQLVHLRNLAHVREVHLDGTRITDQGLERLLGLTKLTTLGLQHTSVSDVGLRELKKLPALKLLLLTGTHVTAETVKQTRKAMLNTRIVLVR